MPAALRLLVPASFEAAPLHRDEELWPGAARSMTDQRVLGRSVRRVVTAVGHDDELGVLWLRLDEVPDSTWRAAFERECRDRDAGVVLFQQHVLCTATMDGHRKVSQLARRIIGATNGAAAGPESSISSAVATG